MTKAGNLRSVRQVATAYPAFSEGGLRWLIFNADQNGFDSVLVRVGRRVLLDMDHFDAWLEERRAG